ncbi:MAG: class I tRNA ligase family protein [candidate division WOR-3 bacterium]
MDEWIISRVMGLVKDIEEEIDSFRISEASRLLSAHFWDEFCDWYLEMIKPRIYSGNKNKRKNALSVALWAFERYLKLMHPFIPHITEEIYALLPHTTDMIINSKWPFYDKHYRNLGLEEEIEFLRSFVNNVRNIRGEFNLPQDLKLKIVVNCENNRLDLIRDQEEWIFRLGGIEEIREGKKVSNSAFFHLRGMDVYVSLEGIIDLDKEKERLNKEINELECFIEKTEKQLSRRDFLNKAPEEVVEKTKEKKERLTNKHNRLLENLKRIS